MVTFWLTPYERLLGWSIAFTTDLGSHVIPIGKQKRQTFSYITNLYWEIDPHCNLEKTNHINTSQLIRETFQNNIYPLRDFRENAFLTKQAVWREILTVNLTVLLCFFKEI